MKLYDLGKFYIDQLLKEKLNIKVHGVSIFKEDITNEGIEKDYFISGKIMNLVSYLATEDASYLRVFDQLRPLLDKQPMKTWGMLYYLEGLYRLKKHNLLDKIKPIDDLNEILHYKHFLNIESMELDHLPTNYYNVAFSICKYRELLNLENQGFSDKILTHFITHVKTYSKAGFMDETNGFGRYDRYSLLTSSEFAMTLMDVGLEVPTFIIEMIKKSKDVVIAMANKQGDGFTYGRSVGAYGDTGVHQILSTAYKLGLLTEEESHLSYAYMIKSLDKYYNFWLIDSNHLNINAYDRQTDAYRHQRRSLGESISILTQWIGIWKSYEDILYKPTTFAYQKHYTRLSEHPLRGLYTYNKQRLITLGIISGAQQYYKMASYQPIPQITGLMESPSINEPIYFPYLLIKGHYYIAHHHIKDIEFMNDSILITYYKLHRLDDFNKVLDYHFSVSVSIKDLNIAIEFNTEGFDELVLYLAFFEKGTIRNNQIILEKSKVDLIHIDKVLPHNLFKTNHGTYKSVFSIKTSSKQFGYKIAYKV